MIVPVPKTCQSNEILTRSHDIVNVRLRNCSDNVSGTVWEIVCARNESSTK
jgi:hypothetical protein